MITLQSLIEKVNDNTYFDSLERYASFCKEYLEYIDTELQARIVATNEDNYLFFQYKDGFAISRPINKNLFYEANAIESKQNIFFDILKHVQDIKDNPELRAILNCYVYTCQVAIGATLDAQNNANAARKKYGQSFENFIRLLIHRIGIDVKSKTTTQKVDRDGGCDAKYKSQHDIIVYKQDVIKAIGSVKTSSKDRLEKIFFDRLIYNMLEQSNVPHFAVFLNDIQRKGNAKRSGDMKPKLTVNTTFVTDHFKAYTILLKPLDGVYYCDLCSSMNSDPFLKQHIRTLDYLLVEDIWNY